MRTVGLTFHEDTQAAPAVEAGASLPEAGTAAPEAGACLLYCTNMQTKTDNKMK